jgi:hypothetical protein
MRIRIVAKCNRYRSGHLAPKGRGLARRVWQAIIQHERLQADRIWPDYDLIAPCLGVFRPISVDGPREVSSPTATPDDSLIRLKGTDDDVGDRGHGTVY